ncbi:hypothetical protein ACQ259_16850 [Stutzerimonas stutzeri]|uniref:hypothetical protein n=1 Tax=Stutzerimonas stutzeri TaxID=316 RepID=UPI003D319088
MIFRRKKKNTTRQLADVVERQHDTGYIFVDITNDLGAAAETIMASSKQTIMAYGYARRAAAAALYIQGVIEEEMFDHVVSIFKSLQIQTEHSVEFQEAAAADAVSYMRGYSSIVSKFMVARLMDIAMNYEIPSGQMSDQQLFASVLDTSHEEQQESQSQAVNFLNSKGQLVPVTGRPIEPDSRSLDGPEYREKLGEFFSLLHELSERPSPKTCKMMVMPCDGSFWSWDFEFSDEEAAQANGVIAELYDYAQGWIQAPTFPLNTRTDQDEDDDIPF